MCNRRRTVTAATSAGRSWPTPRGTGLPIEGCPVFNFAGRRWSDRQLAIARHRKDLTAEPLIYLHTDHAVQGIGSAAVGPGILPQYRLEAGSAEFTFTLAPLPGPAASI